MDHPYFSSFCPEDVGAVEPDEIDALTAAVAAVSGLADLTGDEHGLTGDDARAGFGWAAAGPDPDGTGEDDVTPGLLTASARSRRSAGPREAWPTTPAVRPVRRRPEPFPGGGPGGAPGEPGESGAAEVDAEQWARQFALSRDGEGIEQHRLATQAFEQLLETFADFIQGTARRMAVNAPDPVDVARDLINVGRVALWRNLCRWHPEQGRPFSKGFTDTYIRSQMYRALNRSARPVYLPEDVVKAVVELHRATERGQEDRMLASLAGEMSWNRLNAVLHHRHSIRQQSTQLVEDRDQLPTEGATRHGYVVLSEPAPQPCFDVQPLLGEALGELRPAEREAVEKYYGLGGRPSQTLEEIAREGQVSRERVRQRIGSAMGKLRARLTKWRVCSVDDILAPADDGD